MSGNKGLKKLCLVRGCVCVVECLPFFVDGKVIPTEIRKDAKDLRRDLPYDESQATPTSHVDDEYARAGIFDPKVLITTSRDPSSRLAQFAKEIRLCIPNSQRVNRGNYIMKDLVEVCRSNEVTDLVILHETRGQPDGLIISHFPYGPTVHFTLYNVVLRHDIPDVGTVSEAYPHLIFENWAKREEGSLDVVMRTFGSKIPALAYSSST